MSLAPAFRDVIAFEVAAERGIPDCEPGKPSSSELVLATNLITEEYEETHGAMREAVHWLVDGQPIPTQTLADISDGLADLIWVCNAAAVRLGVDLPAVWDKVNDANMAKFSEGVLRRADGKIIKPKSWQPPDIIGVIANQKPLAELYGEEV